MASHDYQTVAVATSEGPANSDGINPTKKT